MPFSAKNVYSIPAELPFIATLAAGILDHAIKRNLHLADFLILLPTRRAVRSLGDAFLKSSNGKPIILPSILPIGDLDEEEALIMGWEDTSIQIGEKLFRGIPDSISNLHRQLMLAIRINALNHDNIDIDQAALLAGELGSFLDQVQREQLDFSEIQNLAPEEYAQHWQITLKFLEIITEYWPDILKEKKLIDPAERRNLIMKRQLSYWKKYPPKGPIIAAGSTGSIPATANLLAFISELPMGAVILPGLDNSLDIESLEDEETHPQYGLSVLLKKLGLTLQDIGPWPNDDIRTKLEKSNPIILTARKELVFNLMRPPKRISEWRLLSSQHIEGLKGIENITCHNPDEEATIIALKLRQTLETQNKTAALVTPDRNLARRVSSELKRLGINIDDSAGVPVKQTALGTYLRLTAKLISDNFSPIDLLAVGKHPLASAGINPARFRRVIRELEISVLRGPSPLPGIEALLALVDADDNDLKNILLKINSSSRSFRSALIKDKVSLGELVREHIAFSEALAETNRELGVDRMWLGEEGDAVSQFLSELIELSEVLGKINGSSYLSLLEVLFAGLVARRNLGSHPRLAIWGLLEARLQSADLIIIAGLNEGTWPPESTPDPWMSRPMRKNFGLPSLERRIGLTAHDFQQAFLAPEVVMTRSVRVNGSPTVPSRWLVRLQKLLTGLDQKAADSLFKKNYLNYWQMNLDKPAKVEPILPPAPCPPISARPRKLSVTQIETWMRDPYAIYAENILSLKALPKLNSEPDSGDYGTLIHDIMDTFSKQFVTNLPTDALDKLIEIGEMKFNTVINYPGVWAFWWPRFLRVAKWFVDLEKKRRMEIIRTCSEVRGFLTFDSSGGKFELTAKADRIDELKNGSIRIIDYKTGYVPNNKEIEAGFSPQLPLEAAIARSGGFEGISCLDINSLDYWCLRGSIKAGEVIPVGDNPTRLAQDAVKGLSALIGLFDDSETPYGARPRPENAPKFSNYEHLARIKEWSIFVRDKNL